MKKVNNRRLIGDGYKGVSQRTLWKKIKCTTHHITFGYLERSYPEGEADQTSLGGPHWHLKFDKIDGGGEFGGGRGSLYCKCCSWCFKCKALALAVILRCVSPMCHLLSQSYERFKKMIFTWPDLNLEAAATRPPCSLQAVHSCRKYSGATQVPQPRFLQKTSENI